MSAVEQVMCEAVGRASLLPGRNPRKCACSANYQVGDHGTPRSVCGMHFAMWQRACDHDDRERTEALAHRWGWRGPDDA